MCQGGVITAQPALISSFLCCLRSVHGERVCAVVLERLGRGQLGPFPTGAEQQACVVPAVLPCFRLAGCFIMSPCGFVSSPSEARFWVNAEKQKPCDWASLTVLGGVKEEFVS